MMVRWKVEYSVVVLMSVIQLFKSQQCPNDVEGEAKKCVTEYERRKAALHEAHKSLLYMGTDVESIRLLCGSAQTAVQCAIHLKKNCPDREHPTIEGAVIGNLSGIFDLCQYDNFYEVYARHQNCFYKVSASSETCHNTYRARVHNIKLLDSPNSNSKKQFCTYYDTLLICMKTHVQNNCGSEAANLVDVLVRPEIANSNLCRNETTTTTTIKPTKKPQKGRGGGKKKGVRASYTTTNAGYLVNLTASCLIICLIATWFH